ncbi:MAG: hypothetical protein GY820_09620 [Gammaproteobacteria bacterium]|nr:hypothetical protein [Gammaproteobacteria bacterium]
MSVNTLLEKENQWNGDKRTLESWMERFEIQLELLEITDTSKQRNAFLAAIGAEGYEMLRNLVTPKKPKEESFADLKKKLLEFVKPTPVTLMERYNFSHCAQEKDESVSEFLARVKRAAEFCDYKEHYAEAIKDRFVFGLSDASTQKVLLAETKLTLEQAHAKAQAREQAGLHTQTINPGSTTTQVDYVATRKFKTPHLVKDSNSQQYKSTKSSVNKSFVCTRCKLPRSKCTAA